MGRNATERVITITLAILLVVVLLQRTVPALATNKGLALMQIGLGIIGFAAVMSWSRPRQES